MGPAAACSLSPGYACELPVLVGLQYCVDDTISDVILRVWPYLLGDFGGGEWVVGGWEESGIPPEIFVEN